MSETINNFKENSRYNANKRTEILLFMKVIQFEFIVRKQSLIVPFEKISETKELYILNLIKVQ